MIRVNLLPIKQARKRSAGRAQLIIFATLLLVEILVLGFLYFTKADELEKSQASVAQHHAEVNKAKADVSDHARLEEEAAVLAEQLAVLDGLEKGASGPVRLFDELQGILSAPRNEEDRFAQMQRKWLVEWDTRRLWLEKFTDKEKKVELEGFAANADDVAEFLQRLTTARHFTDVQLDYVQAVSDSRGSRASKETTRLVQFRITANITYQAMVSEPPEG